jgi:hypothetical protein
MKEALKVVCFVCFCTLLGLIVIGLLGCAGPSRLEMDHGTSAKLAIVNQTLHPEAARNLEPVTGMDGKSAEALMEMHQKSFEKPAPPASYTISIGSLGK